MNSNTHYSKELKEKEYSFVIDAKGKKLSPTNVNKAWFLIRKKRATLVQKYPMVIQLTKVVNVSDLDTSKMVLGIDDGSRYVGVGIVQHTEQGRKKALLKGTIEQRNNVKKLMDTRRGYRQYRRRHKKYRPKRFLNRRSSKREGRITPTIKQKKQAIIRTIKQVTDFITIDSIVLEDVKVDTRKLVDNKILYGKDYTKTNRLDENIRLAVLMRDGFKCQVTGETEGKLEVHHITPKRLGGNNTLDNLITLTREYHSKLNGKEMDYAEYLYSINKGGNVNIRDSSHVMQGKTYLRDELEKIAPIRITYGTETYRKRGLYGIEKTHSNDAIVIAGLQKNKTNIRDWVIRPLRKKNNGKNESFNGIKHRDLVKFESKRTDTKFIGWVTAIHKGGKRCNVTSVSGKKYKKYSLNSMELVFRFKGVQWI